MEDPPSRQDKHAGKNERRAGWERLGLGSRVSRLTPDHPDYPREWLDKYIQTQNQRLENNGHAEAAVAHLQTAWAAIEPKMLEAFEAKDSESWSKGREILRFALEEATNAIPISDPSMRRSYLVIRALPDYLWPTLITPPLAAPVEIVVNQGPYSVKQTLAPGEIMIRISDIAVRDVEQLFMPLVSKAKTEVLGHNPRPGRPRNLTKNRAVDVLRQFTNLTANQIADMLSIPATTPKVLREKIARHRRRGEQQRETREQERK